MKKLLFIPILLCFSLTSITSAQQKLENYKKIDYIKVKDTQQETFLKLAGKELKTAYQDLIKKGILKSWALYKVQYPGGTKSGYDFISIATGTDLDTIQNQFSDIRTPIFIPDGASKTLTRIASSSSIVKSELWNVENSISKSNEGEMPSKYATMDYMNVAPGKSPDYLMLEDEIAKPIHQERINQGNMAGWQVYSLILPSGTEYGYNFSTFNSFDQLSDVEFGFTNEIINQTMGENANVTELFNTIYNTRDLVKVELWKLHIHAK